MKMLAPVAGQSFNLANGAQYFAVRCSRVSCDVSGVWDSLLRLTVRDCKRPS
jgi:hypothetical protein